MNHIIPRMNADFTAFVAKQAATGHYETRNDPSMSELASMLDKIGKEFERHRSISDEKANAMQSQVEDLETRLARPGAAGQTTTIDSRSAYEIEFKGRRYPVLTKSGRLADFASRGGDFDLADYVRAAVLGGSGQKAASGPALVQDYIVAGLIDAIRAQTTLIEAGAVTIPVDAPGIMARINGDPTVYQHTEGTSDISESDVSVSAVTLNPKILAALVPLTEELVSDSLNLNRVLSTSIAAAFAQKIDALGIAAILADANIPSSSVGQDPNAWANCLTAVGEGLAADQQIPRSMICNTADFIARGSQLASTAGTWLGKPPVLTSMVEYPTTSVSAGTAIYGGFGGIAVCVRQEMRMEVVRWQVPDKATHLLVAHLRAQPVVLQPGSMFIQLKTVV
ncbi:MAG: phage major capsid protein [Rhodocyclaceae bacterium]|nr:phage major capsid protein [Rhodocyclaceae bacterium]